MQITQLASEQPTQAVPLMKRPTGHAQIPFLKVVPVGQTIVNWQIPLIEVNPVSQVAHEVKLAAQVAQLARLQLRHWS